MKKKEDFADINDYLKYCSRYNELQQRVVMEREKQIENAAFDYLCGDKSYAASLESKGFIRGARWADEHPREEPVLDDLKDNGVHAVIDHPFSRLEFPNILPNYRELKEYIEKYDIKDGDEVILQIRKKEK